MPNSRSRQKLTIYQKAAICRTKEENPHIAQSDLAQQYGVKPSTISVVLKTPARWHLLCLGNGERSKVRRVTQSMHNFNRF